MTAARWTGIGGLAGAAALAAVLVLGGGTGVTPPKAAPDYPITKQASIDVASSGVVTGGALDVATHPGFVDVTGGTGWVVNHPANTRTAVTWLPSTGTLIKAGAGVNYVAVNAAGVISVSLTEQDQHDYIRLGHFFVNGGNPIESFSIPWLVGDYPARVNEWSGHAVGALVVNGDCAISTPSALALRMSDCELYVQLSEIVLPATTTVIKMFNSSAGWQIDTATPNLVDPDNYNVATDPAITAKTALTAGWWKKDLVMVTEKGRLYYIFAQAQYATEAEARAAAFPAIPTRLGRDSARLAGILLKQGNATINEIIDIRPSMARVFGFGSGSAAVTLDHGTLAGLADDDHPQYWLDTDAAAHTALATGVHGAGASTLATAANIATHAALTASVHGFDVAGEAAPRTHASEHNAGGTDAMAIDAAAATGSLRTLGTAATAACAGNDARLSDARLPLGYSYSATEGTGTTTGSNFAGVGNTLHTVTTAALTGTYLVQCYAGMSVGAPNQTGEIRCYNVTDADEIGLDSVRPSAASLWSGFTTWKPIVFAGVAKTFAIQFRSPNGSTTISGRRARIELTRVQ